jgi:hypothetical protein
MTARLRPAAALLCLALLTGCAGSSGDAARSTPSPTPSPLTLAQAKDVAAAGVLTTADLPGYEVAAQEADSDKEDFEAQLATCLGVTKPTYFAKDPGRSFSKDELEVDSSVDVAPTREAAKADVAALASAKAPDCVKAQFTKEFGGSGLDVTSFVITPATISVPLSQATAAYRYSIDASSEGQPVAIRGVLLSAAVGQAEISLASTSSPAAALTLDELTALLVKAAARVDAKAKAV